MGHSVLVIDDEENISKTLHGVLSDEGYRVFGAETAEEGIQILTRGFVDCVLLDVWLPGMDGLETAAKFKADARLNHIPIIALTANAMKGDRERCLAAGCDRFAAKPIDRQALIRTIDELVRRG